MKKKEEILKKPQEKRKKRKKKDLDLEMLTPEQRAFIEREEKINKINDKMNQPVLAITYLFAFLIIGLMGYVIHFMVVEKDQVIANAANSRLDKYAANVLRGDIVSSDGKVLATNQGDTRYYPYGDLFAHAVGYSSYSKAGIELIGNFYLSDSNANVLERFVNTLKEEKNEGDTVVSTLDYELQKVAYDALGAANGAVVVMEPDTGKILAMVSKPDFDPNDIDTVWKEATDENNNNENSGGDGGNEELDEAVLLNRATQGLYPPGSTFKVLTTLSYIRQNPIRYKKYSYACTNEESVFNGVSVHCYNRKTHGEQELSDALANSCNQAYADIGVELDVDEWRDTLESFLFNKSLPYTDASATSRFYLDGKSDKGYIPQTAFGQGDTLISPLHNALIVSTIANGGLMMKPYLIDSIENYKGTRIRKFSPSSYDTLLTAKEVEILTDYMKQVVDEGTAADYFAGAPYSVAGKTGTAEYANGEHDYSWFVGFSSVDEPEVVVSILVEKSDVNGVRATAVARKILDSYHN